jgi:hypothetical protein
MGPLFVLMLSAYRDAALTPDAVPPMVTRARLSTAKTKTANGATVGAAPLVQVNGVTTESGVARVSMAAPRHAPRSQAAPLRSDCCSASSGRLCLAGTLACRHYKKRPKAKPGARAPRFVCDERPVTDVTAESERINSEEIKRLEILAPIGK